MAKGAYIYVIPYEGYGITVRRSISGRAKIEEAGPVSI
jgi:hypothetical protein